MKSVLALLGIAATTTFGQVQSGIQQGVDGPVRQLTSSDPIRANAGNSPALGTMTWTSGDLGNNVIEDSGDFSVFPDLVNPDNGENASLTIKYGLWNSPDPVVDTFINGNYVGTFICDQGYVTPGPEFVTFNVTGLLNDGANEVFFTGNAENDGDYVIGQVDLEYSEGGGGGDGDCGLKKSPDQGAFWQPLGPTGSYVYANSFIPCTSGEVDTLGTWLLDQSGTGGPDVRFEVWGSIGGNPANGPDAGNIIAGTGSLNLAGTPTLEFYSAPATLTGSLNAGATYWFVATCVGEGGSGSWQTGAHTQNSEGIVDNGTFWFSNDPAGVNFDGQNFTPEFPFCVETSFAGGPVGYYTDSNQAATDPEAGIIANGLQPVQINTLTGYDFGSLSMLVINEASNGPPSGDVTGALPAIQDWVQQGGKLIVHDRFVSNGGLENNPFFIGAPGMLAMRDFSNDANVDIQTAGTEVTEGSFGTLNDASLDGGTSSTHGWVDAATLPTNQSVAILELGGEPSKIAGLSYILGDGAVYYSSIPLDYYLAGNGPTPPQADLANVYYPNVIEYMLNLQGGGGCYPDCNGDGVLNILDFVCYQGLFQAGDAAADCNADGVLNILDFVCFQGEFQAGCN